MTKNKKDNRTGGSCENTKKRSDGVVKLSSAVPVWDSSGTANDRQLKSHEPDIEIVNTAQQQVEWNISDIPNDGLLNIHKPNPKIMNTAQQLVERNSSDIPNDNLLNNDELDKEIVNTTQLLSKQNASGIVDTIHENNHVLNKKTKDTPRLVERATALRGLSICPVKNQKSIYRKRTEQDLNTPDAEIPYVKTELAIRNLICSLMERQDRMNEEIFLKLNDFEYRIDDLEPGKPLNKTKQSCTDEEVFD